jgi:hypothetical protein
MAGNRVVNFPLSDPRERPSGPHRVAGWTGANPTTGREKGAPLQTLRVCRARCRVARDLPSPAYSRPDAARPNSRAGEGVRCTPFNPPRGPRDARRGAGPAPRQKGPGPSCTSLAGDDPTPARRGASWRLRSAEEGRSPLGSPLRWQSLAGDRPKRGRVQQPQALSSRPCRPLRERLTPPPAPELGGSAALGFLNPTLWTRRPVLRQCRGGLTGTRAGRRMCHASET